MKAYILPSGATISPFGDPASAVRVLNRTLAERRREVLARLGIEAVPVENAARVPAGGGLVLLDHVFFARRALREFLKATEGLAGDAVLALPDSAFCRETRPLQDDVLVEPDEGGGERYVYGVFRTRGPAASLEEMYARARRVVIPFREKVRLLPHVEPARTDPAPGPTRAVTLQAVVHVRHWSHILDIHAQALYERRADLDARKVLSNAWRALTAFPWDRWAVARRLVYRGKGCDVHPTAVVEDSVLGDGVEIGPQAVVRGSVIGEGTKVEEHAEVLYSAIGDRCVCSFRSRALFSVVYPRSLISYPGTPFSVVGERAVQTGGSFVVHRRPDASAGDAEVPVLHQGREVGSGKTLLGACLGHRAVVGTGLWLGCGLEVPNGAFVVRDPGEVAKKFAGEFEPGAPMTVRDGRVVAIPRATKPAKPDG